ncbi:MAG: hypothetical protein JNK48_07295 [Bryobacterales bacterium]|nr:hypothetical protein [Bryobacterales bacterium]
MTRLLLALALFACSALAADISGTWKGMVETPNGSAERTFVFKVDGEKLTGETTSSLMGKSAIMDGKISGDTLSFKIHLKFDGNDLEAGYKGKVTGSEIKMTVEVAGQTLEYSVKKVN